MGSPHESTFNEDSTILKLSYMIIDSIKGSDGRADMTEELVDITGWLKQATAELPVGYMVKKPELAMLEAMSSIEMFNPKMDTGMTTEQLDKNGAGPSRTAKTKEEMLFDSQRGWRPEQLLWIMDEMLVAEIAWYRGVNLAQSVFECLYYMYIDRLEGPNTPELISVVLRAWLAAYCKCIDLAHKELSKGHVNDMEDVWLDHYGLAVYLDDLTSDIDAQLGGALDWLETWQYTNSDGDVAELGEDGIDKTRSYRAAFQARLTIRQKWLRSLHFIPQSPPYTHIIAMPPPEEVQTEPPDGLVFDSVIPYLRQNMPPPIVSKPSHEKAFLEMRQILDAVDELVVRDDDLLSWQIATRGRSWIRRDASIVRSLYKTWLDERVQNIAGRYISLLTGLPDYSLYELEVSEPHRKVLAIWRDIVGGLTITTLSTPCLNRARQRRSYQSLSFSWRERSAIAYWLGFHDIHAAMYAIRLDCLLEGALAAFDLDLIARHEERQAWWWIWQVAYSRAEIGLEDWGHTWAEMWSAIAQMTFWMLSLHPNAGPDTKEQFELRHKWAIKIPTMSDGTKLDIGLTPKYSDWCKARDEQRDPAEIRESITMYGDAALNAMLRLHRSDLGSDSKNFRLVLADLREDVHHDMKVTCGKWGKRRRWVPLLE